MIIPKDEERRYYSYIRLRDEMKKIGDTMGLELLNAYPNIPYDILSKLSQESVYADSIYNTMNSLDSWIYLMRQACREDKLKELGIDISDRLDNPTKS